MGLLSDVTDEAERLAKEIRYQVARSPEQAEPAIFALGPAKLRDKSHGRALPARCIACDNDRRGWPRYQAAMMHPIAFPLTTLCAAIALWQVDPTDWPSAICWTVVAVAPAARG